MAKQLKAIIAISIISILAIIAAEVLARVVVVPLISNKLDEDYSADVAAYAEAQYDVAQLHREIQSSYSREYQPYIVWRRRPFQGTMINIAPDGMRTTFHNSSQNEALQVWMFGGSTMWGWGVPDDETIPSQLAKLLNEEWRVDSQVYNFGEDAFVSTQELIYLIRELQTGKRPDVVVFYDGTNDAAAAALWPQVPGTHHNLDSIRARFHGAGPSLASRVRSTGLFRVMKVGMGQIGIKLVAEDTSGASVIDEAQRQRLGQQAIDVWLENHRIVSALGQAYGFIPLFLFQPALGVGSKPLDASEQELLATTMKRPEGKGTVVHEQLRLLLQERLRSQGDLAHLYDLSDIFRDTPQPVYLDWTHASDTGNRVIAKSILEVMWSELCRESPMHIDDSTRRQLSSACAK